MPFLRDSVGLRCGQVIELRECVGDNQLQGEMPTFLQWYGEQLLTPLVVFQVFVALLRVADDFASDMLTQLAFIGMFESTAVLQRLMTMKILDSARTEPYGIKVFRGKIGRRRRPRSCCVATSWSSRPSRRPPARASQRPARRRRPPSRNRPRRRSRLTSYPATA